jgi:hypothetical protein
MKSRALTISRSGTPAKSIKPPTKVSNAATVNNTRRNQTPDAAATAVLAVVAVKPEEFSDTLTSCDSSTGHRNPVWFSARSLRRSACGWTISEITLWGQRPLIGQLDKLSYWDCKAALYPAGMPWPQPVLPDRSAAKLMSTPIRRIRSDCCARHQRPRLRVPQ